MKFNMDMMKIEGTIYRPPVEADTFLLQVTAGCTHNACNFCNMYREKTFHLIDEEILRFNLAEGKRVADIYKKPIRRIFLMDGDVFSLSTEKLESVIALIRQYMPEMETISMYAPVRSIKKKTDDELAKLQALGVNDLHIGYESGLDDVLQAMNKNSTLADSVEQAERLRRAGIRHNGTFILGLAGKGRGEESGRAMAVLINRLQPQMVRLMTLSVFDDAPLAEAVQAGTFVEAGEKEILREEQVVLEGIALPELYFWANHVLNSTPVAGYIGQDREWMMKRITRSLEELDEEQFRKTFRRTHL